jgi:hypothetical protein
MKKSSEVNWGATALDLPATALIAKCCIQEVAHLKCPVWNGVILLGKQQ